MAEFYAFSKPVKAGDDSGSEERHSIVYESPFGSMEIWAAGGALVQLDFYQTGFPPCEQRAPSPVLEQAVKELDEYFSGRREAFHVPLSPRGTLFQRRVWQALCAIPYGQTRSYGEIAAVLGNPKASRAVGMANHRNPLMIFIPCHRVVGRNGSLVGYAGGLEMKQGLLELEQKGTCLPGIQKESR